VPITAEALPNPVAETQCGRTKSQFRNRLLIGTGVPLIVAPSAAAGAAPTTLAAAMSNAAVLASPLD
jgi:hypothetical protein